MRINLVFYLDEIYKSGNAKHNEAQSVRCKFLKIWHDLVIAGRCKLTGFLVKIKGDLWIKGAWIVGGAM